ncbi:hypothetical protein IKE79_00510 [Candidatus Saccharibacteria bacterium]|nr:hypothetical protein [Candidatus Saccharibacteria bacterium]
MIRIFTGEDRVRAKQEITKLLGADYEVLDGADITTDDLPSIFKGMSLFTDHRYILIRDLTVNKPVYEKLPEYLDTPHDIILFESKLDKRTATYKAIKDQVEVREFAPLKSANFNLVFDIYRTAKRDGARAVQMLEQIQTEEDPIMFTGLMVSQAIKDYSAHPGVREKRILKELARTDLQQKTTGTDPWLLVKSFLLRLPTL